MAGDCKRRFQRERPDEHRQSAQNRTLDRRQQVVAPAQRRAERLMPRNGRPPPAPQQREAGVEKGSGAGDAIGVDTTGGEFDRQRDAVQPPANFGNQGSLVLADLEFAQACGDAFDEKLGRWIGKDFRSAQSVALRRAIQRKQPEDALAFGAKGLTAGREDVEFGQLPNEAFRQRRQRVQYVFAAVEDQKHMPAAQECQQAGQRILRAGHESQR